MTTQTKTTLREIKLGEIADFQYGYTASAKKINTGTKFLRITDIVPDLIDWETVPFCDIEKEKMDKYQIHKGDILIARTGTVGSAKLIRREPEPAVFASYLIRLKLKDKDTIPEFVGRIIESEIFKQFISTHVGGAAQPHANAPVLKNFEVSIPSLPTQKQIVNVLSAYDDLIENNMRRIKILEEIAKVIYREWFVYFRFPGHEKVKMIDSKTEFGEIPQGWVVKNLGDKINIFRGKNITKNTIVEGKIPVVAGGLGPAYFHNKANAEGPVITMSASGANAGYVNLYHEDIWASDCSYINKSSTPFVYYYYLLLKDRQIEVTGLQRGSAQPHVYPKDLTRLSIVDAPEEMVRTFEEEANSLFGVINNLQMRNQKLCQARDLLLPKLITGDIKI